MSPPDYPTITLTAAEIDACTAAARARIALTLTLSRFGETKDSPAQLAARILGVCGEHAFANFRGVVVPDYVALRGKGADVDGFEVRTTRTGYLPVRPRDTDDAMPVAGVSTPDGRLFRMRGHTTVGAAKRPEWRCEDEPAYWRMPLTELTPW